MPKTQEELTQLKTEYETLTTKLKELTEEELNMVVGGHTTYSFQTRLPNNQSWKCPECGNTDINNLRANDSRDSRFRQIRCKECLYIGFADEFKA